MKTRISSIKSERPEEAAKPKAQVARERKAAGLPYDESRLPPGATSDAERKVAADEMTETLRAKWGVKAIRFDMLACGDVFQLAEWSDNRFEKTGTRKARMIVDGGVKVSGRDEFNFKTSGIVLAHLVSDKGGR